jgi:hypothetical protein
MRDWTRAIILEAGFKDEAEFPGVKVATFRELEDFLELRAEGPFRVRYVPESAEEFELICEWAEVLGGVQIIVEEAHRFMGGQVPTSANLLRLLKMGRHFGGRGEGVTIIAVSDNPFDFPIAFRRQVTKALVFNTAEPNDVKWLAELIGREWAERAPLLKVGQFIEWTRGVGCAEKTLEALS